jgi:hypothetical protein
MRSGRCWPTAELASPGGGGKQPQHRLRPPEPTTRSPPLQVGLSGVLVGATRRPQVAGDGRRWQDGKPVTRQMPSRATSPRAIQKKTPAKAAVVGTSQVFQKQRLRACKPCLESLRKASIGAGATPAGVGRMRDTST